MTYQGYYQNRRDKDVGR